MSEKVKIVSVFVLICFIWGSTWLAIRIGLETLTPMFSAGVRFILASLMILLWMKYRGLDFHKDSLSIRLYILMGIFSFVIPFGLVYWAEQFVPSGLAAVLFAVFPFFVVLFSYLLIPSESIGFLRIIGIIIGFAGILVIFSDDLGGDITSYLLGMSAVVISGIMQAAIAVIIKKYGHHLNPFTMNFIPMTIAGISLFLGALIFEDLSNMVFSTGAVLSMFYLALFGSIVTFTSYYWLLKRVNVILLSLTAFITPIVALVIGWLAYNEQLTTNKFWGSILVLTGLLWANLGNLSKLKNRKLIKPV
jgi:drug/metabolite transporter (DMT)-like permease